MTTSTPPPDPHEVLEIVRALLVPFQAKALPTTLQLYAHLQLISRQVRSEARRALAEQARLVKLLEEAGVDESEWVRQGSLKKRDGHTLKKIAALGEEDEVNIEDVMMELSFKLRLYHLALIFARGPKPASVKPLFDTYFPALPKEPGQNAPARAKNSFSFIRAMDSTQARSLQIYHTRAQSMFQAATDAHAEGRKPLLLKAMLLEFDDEESMIKKVISIGEDVVRDYDTFQRIFGPDETFDNEGAVDDEKAYGTQEAVDEQEGERTHTQEAAEATAIPQTWQSEIFEDGDSQMDAMYDMVDHSYAEGPSDFDALPAPASSPPPIHTFRSSAKPRLSSTMIFTPTANAEPTDSISAQASAGRSPHPSSHAKKPRLSGLPPPSGPDYMSPRTSPSASKHALKPFSNSKLQHRASSSTPAKRSRLSSGFGNDDIEEFRYDKRSKDGAADSSDYAA